MMTRDEAIDALDNLLGMIEDNHDTDYDEAFKMAINALKQAERKKGKWYDVGSLSCRCSNCGCKSEKESSFCPHCGAEMK